jgi:hypothetical protein
MASVAGSRPPCKVSTIRFRRPGSGCPAVWCLARPVSSPSVSGHLGSSSGVRRSGRLLSTRPASGRLLFRPCPSGRVRLVPRQAVALGPGRCGGATFTTGTGRGPGGLPRRRAARSTAGEAWTRATLPRARVGQWGVGGGPGRVRFGRRQPRLTAARPGRPGRRAERPWMAAARGHGSRRQREVAALAGWLPSWAGRVTTVRGGGGA